MQILRNDMAYLTYRKDRMIIIAVTIVYVYRVVTVKSKGKGYSMNKNDAVYAFSDTVRIKQLCQYRFGHFIGLSKTKEVVVDTSRRSLQR